MGGATQEERETIARSWALEMLLRRDDHEMWVSDAVRFPTREKAEAFGDMLLAMRSMYVRYRVIPSNLPPTLGWLLPT